MSLPTIIFRHKKENLKKCSLRGLEQRKDFQFFTYPCKEMPLLDNYIVLTIDAPPLSLDDAHMGLCLVDATWVYADNMIEKLQLKEKCICRSIPNHYRTAYPRKQTGCIDPDAGLASIEALYVAFNLLNKNTEGLLDNYYWASSFLAKNDFI